MTFSLKGRKDDVLLNIMHSEEMQDVGEQKKTKPQAATEYNDTM
jgi:hypothetical protein